MLVCLMDTSEVQNIVRDMDTFGMVNQLYQFSPVVMNELLKLLEKSVRHSSDTIIQLMRQSTLYQKTATWVPTA
jgi:hypothetical protein